MVIADMLGLTGNNLFQYILGRILAENTGRELTFAGCTTEFDIIFREFGLNIGRIIGADGVYALRHAQQHTYWNDQFFSDDFKNGGFSLIDAKHRQHQLTILNGFFQRYDYYRQHKKIIRDWIKLPQVQLPLTDNDVVMHLRVGDFSTNKYICPAEHYHKCLSQVKYDKLYLVTEDPNHQFTRNFDKYNPVIFQADWIPSFMMLAKAKKLIMSNSTYCWWAAFLGEAEVAYHPVMKIKCPWTDTLFIHDEPRFIRCDYPGE